jgi:hypothetical protein
MPFDGLGHTIGSMAYGEAKHLVYNIQIQKCVVLDECDGSLYKMRQFSTTGFDQTAGAAESLPLDSHPVHCMFEDELWTQKPWNMKRHTETPRPPGHITQCLMEWGQRVNAIMVGSDGSTHRTKRVAACAWLIYVAEDKTVKACVALEHMTSITSFRSELEGMYRGLLQVEQMDLHTNSIAQWCDNKAAVDSLNARHWTPQDMLAPDADILLAINGVTGRIERTGVSLTRKHVYGHQDTKQRGKEDRASTAQTLSIKARINVECDKLATETTKALMMLGPTPVLPEVVTLPYEGSKAMLRIGTSWITSGLEDHILITGKLILQGSHSAQDAAGRTRQWITSFNVTTRRCARDAAS